MSTLAPAYIEAGPHSAKTTLVFLHGIGGGKKGFQSSVDFFAEQGFRPWLGTCRAMATVN